nr:protein Mpv17-like [Leptinotarsa decemlineata]
MNKSGRILKLYKKLLNDHFVMVQAVQTGTLMGTGDLIAQTIIEKKSFKQVHLWRTARFFAIGAVMVGPTISIWYRALSKYIGHTGKSVVLKKVALDQFVFAPTFLALFITVMNTLEGHSWDFIKLQLKKKYKDILITNYEVWPPIQLFNFYFIPLQYQVLLVQVVALFWNAYLSWKTEEK